MAVVLGMVFLLVVSSLLHYLSGERKQVGHVIGHKQAELLALSGIDWADQELRKGRWYQKPFGASVTGANRQSYGVKEDYEPFGRKNGKVTIVCVDIPAKEPAYNVMNMQQLWLLHHIDVYSLGEFEGAKCLVYGRFIMSPEPALNSDSTLAAIYGGGSGDGEYGITPFTSASKVIVEKIHRRLDDQVDINTVVLTLKPADGVGGSTDIRAPSHGRVKSIDVVEGSTYSAGEELFSVKREDSSGVSFSSKTLRRMVRITKIDEKKWASKNILDFNDRYALSSYIRKLSDVYLMNFMARQQIENAAKQHEAIGLSELSPDEFLRKFPPNLNNLTKNRAENEFLIHFLKNFTIASPKDAEKAITKTYFRLNHKRTNPPSKMVDALRIAGRMDALNSKPRKDPTYWEPGISNNQVIDLLKPSFDGSSRNFIKSLAYLEDASRDINIVVFTPDEPVGAPPKYTVSYKKLVKSYDFVDPEGLCTPVEHLLEFGRKYYSDDDSIIPREAARSIEFLDWPNPKPRGPQPPSSGSGKWVWIPGVPGSPPGNPDWKAKSTISVPSPSGGGRKFEEHGTTGKTYNVNGIEPLNVRDRGSNNGMAGLGDGDFNSGNALNPDQHGDGNSSAGSPPEGDGNEGGNPAGAPTTDGSNGGRPAGAPQNGGSMFPGAKPSVDILPGEGLQGTPGTNGIPPKEGEWAWVEPCPPGGAPAGGGAEGANAQNGQLPADSSGTGNGNEFPPPGGQGNSEGNGLNTDGTPAEAVGNGLGNDGSPADADGFGQGADGNPGNADGLGYGNDGSPGDADGYGLGSPNRPGSASGNAGADNPHWPKMGGKGGAPCRQDYNNPPEERLGSPVQKDPATGKFVMRPYPKGSRKPKSGNDSSRKGSSGGSSSSSGFGI